MSKFNPNHGLGTQVVHATEDNTAHNANVTPIYQTSIFRIPDVATGRSIFLNETEGHVYSRLSNPTLTQVAQKLAVVEGLDLLRANPDKEMQDVVRGRVFASGMAAVTSGILARVKSGEAIIVQEALYSATFSFLHDMAPRYGIEVVWVPNPTIEAFEKAFNEHKNVSLAYIESPVNPTLSLVDIQAVTELAHQHGAWVMVDNTFATPYCQRPLTLGADIVIHSTTKYLNGHGLIIGGALISPHLDFMKNDLSDVSATFGATSSPFDTWLLNNGLKTFELRMERQCANAMKVAEFLEVHPAVGKVNYPGLKSFEYHDLAARQMTAFGGMMSFELKGGLDAGESMMNKVGVCRLAVSLGHLDTLIEHPASMTHFKVEPEMRRKVGITDGLVRLSVGIENVEDILADLDQAMQR